MAGSPAILFTPGSDGGPSLLSQVGDPFLYLGIAGLGPASSAFPSDDYSYGQSPLYIPTSLGVSELAYPSEISLQALTTVRGGASELACEPLLTRDRSDSLTRRVSMGASGSMG